MFDLTLPLPYLIAASYLFLTASSFILWYYWDTASSIANQQSGRSLIAFTIGAVLLGFFIANIANRGLFATSMEPPSRQEDYSCPTDDLNQYPTNDRTRFSSDLPKIHGYPSSGGVLMLPLDIAVAEHLEIPRLEIALRDPDPVAEDAFCDRLRLLGAKWWESEDSYMRKLIGIDEMSEAEAKEEIVVGWPDKEGEGGVWILRTRTPDAAMLGMCVTMKERCDLLERWGATFYGDPREVEEFEGVLCGGSTQHSFRKSFILPPSSRPL